jgi:hypothetical protein
LEEAFALKRDSNYAQAAIDLPALRRERLVGCFAALTRIFQRRRTRAAARFGDRPSVYDRTMRFHVGIACALAPILATTACTTHYEVTPTTAAEVRTATRDVRARGTGTVHGNDGVARNVDALSNVSAVESGYSGTLGTLASDCDGSRPCAIDDPRAKSWRVSTTHRELALGPILFGGAAIGFVGLNVGCLAADACADTVKTTIVVTDIVVGVSLVVLVVALANAITMGVHGD